MRASACPGLLRIVNALDGGICRVKLPCGQLTTAQAEAIAAASSRYSSGIIEITNRANLQIRGIQSQHADALTAALLDIGLGAATPGGDDVRNVMVSPSAGIDVGMSIDTAPLAQEILALLQTQSRLHELSPKFSLSLDGGENLAMLEHPHDIWLSALPTASNESTARFVFGLAGCPASGAAIAVVDIDQVTALVEAALHTFLDLASIEQSRMRQLLQIIPVQEFLARVQTRLLFELNTDVAAWQRKSASAYAHIGIHAQRQPTLNYIGAVPVLGRIDADQLRALAKISAQHGDGALRLTPWQSVLLPNIDSATAAIVAHELQKIGFSTRVDEPLAHLIACTGARGCAKGLADTKTDALQFAQLLKHYLPKNATPPIVHFSGCARSCASASIAPFTLLAVGAGRYDVFKKNSGDFFRQKNSAAEFGELIARDVAVSQVLEILEKFDD